MTDDTSALHYRSTLPGWLGAIDTGISHLEAWLLALGVLLMALNTIVNVLARVALGESLFFSEEVNRILIIMITFAGIGYAARHGRHIRMSAFYDLLPHRARQWLMIMIALVTALIMFTLCSFAIGYIETQYSRGRVLPALGIPVFWIYLWVPLGFAITGLQYLLTALKNLRSDVVYLSTHVIDQPSDSDSSPKGQ